MEITRVQVLADAARTAAWPQANAADQEHAVFRRLSDRLRGAVRLCADRGCLVPGIINDGRRLIDEAQPLVLDFPSDGVLLDLVARFAADHGLSVFNDESRDGARSTLGRRQDVDRAPVLTIPPLYNKAHGRRPRWRLLRGRNERNSR